MLVSSKRSSTGQYYKVGAPEENGYIWDNGFKILGRPKRWDKKPKHWREPGTLKDRLPDRGVFSTPES